MDKMCKKIIDEISNFICIIPKLLINKINYYIN